MSVGIQPETKTAITSIKICYQVITETAPLLMTTGAELAWWRLWQITATVSDPCWSHLEKSDMHPFGVFTSMSYTV